MIGYFCIFSLITFALSYEPSCLTCKFYKINTVNTSVGTCERFKVLSSSNSNDTYTFVNKFAINCRNNEELCGKLGKGYQPKLDENIKKENEDDDDEIEKLEKEFFDIFQKIKKHNKRQIYKKTTDLYKLFRCPNK
jgi:hypothetical protein